MHCKLIHKLYIKPRDAYIFFDPNKIVDSPFQPVSLYYLEFILAGGSTIGEALATPKRSS
jgi:hypothetical protein